MYRIFSAFALVIVIIISSLALPVTANDENMVLGDPTPEIIYTYYSMYNTGYFPNETGVYTYIYPHYTGDMAGQEATWERCLFPSQEYSSNPRYYWKEPSLGNDDSNSTFLYSIVSDAIASGGMLRQVEINATDEYSLDFIIRYCGITTPYEGETATSFIGLYSNASYVPTYDLSYYRFDTFPSEPRTGLTGIQIDCMIVGGASYMRFYARTAENGLLGNCLIGPMATAHSLSNTLYHVAINRYNDSGIWKESFYISNEATGAYVFSDVRNIAGSTYSAGWFAYWDNTESADLNAVASTHVLELKNMTSYGQSIPDGSSDFIYSGHTFRIGKLIFEDEELPEENETMDNSTVPDIFPDITPNESLAIVILVFGTIFMISTAFFLRRK